MSQYFTEVSSYLAAIGETDIINGNHLARGICLKQQLINNRTARKSKCVECFIFVWHWHLTFMEKNQSFFFTANFNLLYQSIPLEKCKSCSIFHEFYRALICSFCFRIRKKIVKRKTSNIRTVFIHHAIQWKKKLLKVDWRGYGNQNSWTFRRVWDILGRAWDRGRGGGGEKGGRGGSPRPLNLVPVRKFSLLF